MSQENEVKDKKSNQPSSPNPRGLIAIGIGVIILLIAGLIFMISLLV